MNQDNFENSIESFETLRDVFEDGTQFINTIYRTRALGGREFYQQLFLDKVKVSVPIVIGVPSNGPSIAEILPQRGPMLFSDNAHLIFNSGEFTSLHFTKYHTSYINPSIMDLHKPSTQVEIHGGEFFGSIRFSNSKLGRIRITGGIFHKEVCFERGVYEQIEISGGDFRGGLYFGNIIEFERGGLNLSPPPETPQWTSNNDGIFFEINITGGSSKHDVQITSCFVKNILLSSDMGVEVKNVTCVDKIELRQGAISISNCKSHKTRIGSKRTSGKLIIDDVSSQYNILEFKDFSGKDSLISYRKIETNSCRFEDFINYGSIVFNSLKLVATRHDFRNSTPNREAQTFNYRDYRNDMFYTQMSRPRESVLALYAVALEANAEAVVKTYQSSISFINTDAGKTSMIDCSISDSQMGFKNSKLTDIFLAGTDFPSYKNIDSGHDSKQKRLAMSQIRKVYESRGDSILAGEYHSAELEILRDEAKWRGSFSEKFPLTLNYISNKHTQNWIPSFWLWLGVGFGLWIIISFLLFEIPVFNIESIIVFLNSLIYFTQFLLPIHKLDLVDEFALNVAGVTKSDELSSWALPIARAIDAIWRLVSGYLTYQLIAAFRKHGKR